MLKVRRLDQNPILTPDSSHPWESVSSFNGCVTRDGKKYRCIKVSALLVEGTIFKGGEDMLIWITDDSNRIPVLVEAKILIGSVKACLNKVEGNSFEIKALVK